jgi:hypothetical protein
MIDKPWAPKDSQVVQFCARPAPRKILWMLYALRTISAKQARWLVEFKRTPPNLCAKPPVRLNLYCTSLFVWLMMQHTKPPRRFSGRSQVACV